MGYVSPASLLAMAVCFLNTTTLLLMLRFVVRRLQKFALGLDDWFILPAWLLMTAMCINTIVGVAYGRLGVSQGSRLSYGRKSPYGENPDIAQADQFSYVLQILQPGALAFAKMSVLFFYRRMLCPESLGPFHKQTRIAIGLVAIWGALFTFLYAFQCGDQFGQIWNPTVGYKCLGGGLDVSFTSTDALFDIAILILPVPKIMSLRLPWGKKLAIVGAFAVGGLTTTISVVRAVVMISIENNVWNPTFWQSSAADEAMIQSIVMYWGLFETGTAVIVACLPSLQYLFRKFLPEQVKKSKAASAEAAGSGSKSTASPLKSIDVLEKASVMTMSTNSPRPSFASTAAPTVLTFNSRPVTPAAEVPPPLPSPPATAFSGFHSRSATLTSTRQGSTTSGAVTPIADGELGKTIHKGSVSKQEWEGFDGVSPVERTGTMDSRTRLWDSASLR